MRAALVAAALAGLYLVSAWIDQHGVMPEQRHCVEVIRIDRKCDIVRTTVKVETVCFKDIPETRKNVLQAVIASLPRQPYYLK